MINEFDAAIRAFFQASPLANVLTGGLWPDEAPQGAQLPFGTYEITGATPDDATSQDVENVFVTFRLRSGERTPLEIGAICKAFIAAFDYAAIPVAEHVTIRLDRTGGSRAKDQDGGYVVPLTYKWVVQHV